MVFIVEFADGRAIQVAAGVAMDAKRAAVAKFKDRLVVRVRAAGLHEMAYRPTPFKVTKLLN